MIAKWAVVIATLVPKVSFLTFQVSFFKHTANVHNKYMIKRYKIGNIIVKDEIDLN